MWDLEMEDVQNMDFEEERFCSRVKVNEKSQRPRG